MGWLRRLSGAEAATLAALTAWGFAPLILMLLHAASRGDVITGADGAFAADQLQYISWAREGGDHVLADNAFDLRPSADSFLHPMFLISGAVWKAGLGLEAAYLAWKPVALLVLFAGFTLFVRRTVSGSGARTAALLLALFYAVPAAALLDWTATGSGEARTGLAELLGETLAAGHLWGSMPTAIAVGLMPLYLLAAERGLEQRGRERTGALAAASVAGLLAAWLHPWQGQVLAVVTVGLLAWGRLRRPVWPLLVPLAATLLPLLYYVALSELDTAWEVARRQNEEPSLSPWVLLAGLAPLLVLAPLGASRQPRELTERALLVWPVAAVVVHGALSPSVPAHALEGLALPLAVLSVRGWRSLGLPAPAGALAVAALTLPGAVFAADSLRSAVRSEAQPHYLRSAEARAMDALRRDPRPGGVIAELRVAPAVPVRAGRAVWAGHPSWTPDYGQRARAVDELFRGALRGPRAAMLLHGSGARFALAGCGRHADLRLSAPDVVARVQRVDCATIYELRTGGPPGAGVSRPARG